MEARSAQDQPRDRPQPAFPRAASRSTTRSMQSRNTPVNANGPESHLSSPTQQSGAAHLSDHLRQRAFSRGSAEPQRSQLSREAPEHLKQTLPRVSSFLRERLQKERRVESERSSSRTGNVPMSASMDLGAIHSSPTRSGISDGRRPRSSDGDNPTKRKGWGVKEMEQTLSTLHKQNFDLKLELFHRRERQTALEERLDKLESEKSDAEKMNDRLLAELEKRDKVVQEAVAMIVSLENKVEQLLREREMVRRIDTDSYSRSLAGHPVAGPAASRSRGEPFQRQPSETRELSRMPSFLSDQSETTENLRNLYLSYRASLASLPKMSEDAVETERGDPNGVRSPALSVLSESSFLSVYGHKDGGASSPAARPIARDEIGEDGALLATQQQPGLKPSAIIGTPSKPEPGSAARNSYSGNAKFQNINNILVMEGSPLQWTDRMEQSRTSRPPSQDNCLGVPSDPGRPAKAAANQQRSKQERRESLQRVLTNAPLARDTAHPNGFPPTPDTISTTTLQRFGNSNDNLIRDKELSTERSYLALSETTTSQLSDDGRGAPLVSASDGFPTQNQSAHLLDSFGEPLVSRADFANRANRNPSDKARRPKPADLSLEMHRRGHRRGEPGADSSGDDDGAASTTSSFDCWMRESMKPNQSSALGPISSVSQAGSSQIERVSPDLFSFPSTTNGWATDAMFGALRGSGYLAAARCSLPPGSSVAQTLSQSSTAPSIPSGFPPPVLDGTGIPPPPPSRRSSLHAQTGSSSAAIHSGKPGSSPLRQSPAHGRLKHGPDRIDRLRSNSVDARPPSRRALMGFAQARAPTAPPQNYTAHDLAQQQQPHQKHRHYPPVASQQPRGRGLNNLFRRSVGSAEQAAIAPPMSAPPAQTLFEPPPAPAAGAAPWSRRVDLFEDDRSGATPPPIMRNRAATKGSFDSLAAAEGLGGGGAPVGAIPGAAGSSSPRDWRPSPPDRPSSAAAAGVGGVRKWLGLSRVGSLRNRAT